MADGQQPIRVMLAKLGLDGHDRGVKVVARTLRDAGMEVIYTGLHRTPEQVIEAAVQEDVDVLGVSILSGAHLPIFRKLYQVLDAFAEPVGFAVVAGGVMPDEDEETLKKMGVAAVLGQDTTPDTIVEAVRAAAADRTVGV
ncbi:MAG: 2-hydroxyisobutanoyl-CoA mutase small subunit [Pseudonocardiales bacterium]|jgi:methylmalonyl-CoA mutase C-terminal domain/subunit|nr:2-hydroxyisobutanoyl-CoA mutase small subunit [Pseudonocardiales bacterium]MDT7608339.1 2-hydroxyisobutanoyl-CoA mutase small subunit [Pseudonocardiales bacterium]